MLQEPRRNADGTWRWALVFRPRVHSERVVARPVEPRFSPCAGKRLALLVNLACNGISGPVSLRGD